MTPFPTPTRVAEWIVRATDAGSSDSAFARTERCFAVLGGLAYLVFPPFLAPAIADAMTVTAPWWTPAAFALMVLPGILAGIHALLSSDLTALRRSFSVAALGVPVVAALWLLAWTGEHLPVATVFWVGSYVILGSIWALLAWRPPVAFTYLAVTSIGIKLLGDTVQGIDDVSVLVTDAMPAFAFALVPMSLGTASLRAARELDRTNAHVIELAEAVAATRARSAERLQARALTHDRIIANLLEAVQNPDSPRLPERARDTLRALDASVASGAQTGDCDAATAVRFIGDVALHSDPHMTVRSVIGSRPGATFPMVPVAALSGAVAEAARNCFRHLDSTVARRCVIVITDDAVRVTVDDDGPGFERDAVAPQRLGIALSIEERVHAVTGGQATVSSTPAGTTVALSWSRQRSAHDVDPADILGLRSTTARWLAALVVGLLLLAAALSPGADEPSLVVALTAVILVAGTAAVMWGRRDPPEWLPTLITMASAPLMCGIYLAAFPDAERAVPLWVVGPPALLLGLLAIRGRNAAATLAFVITVVVVAVWAARRLGDPMAGVLLIGPSGGFLVISIAFGAVIRSLARALADARHRAADEAAAASALRAASDERSTALAPITALARPLLVRLADPHPVDAATRDLCRITEARLRDLLRSPALCSPQLEAAVDAARRRGVTVTLLDDRAAHGEDQWRLPPPADAEQQCAVSALHHARDGSVHIRALPRGRTRTLTILAADGSTTRWYDVDDSGVVRSGRTVDE